MITTIIGVTPVQNLTVERIEQILNANNYDGFIDDHNNIFIVRASVIVCLSNYYVYTKSHSFAVKAFCYIDITADCTNCIGRV